MKNVKIGACDWALPGGGLYATQIAAAYNLQALSLRIGLYENDYPITHPEMQNIYLEQQQRYGIEYCAIALNDFDNIPMHARKGTPQYDIVWNLLARAVDTACALGIPLIQVPGFAASEIKSEQDMVCSAEAFSYLCEKAGEKGIQVAAENLQCVSEFQKLHEMVNAKNFYLYFDTQNYQLFRGYSTAEMLEGLYPYMCNQLHVKDGLGAMSGGLLGSGDAGFYEAMSVLQQHRFEGYILLENYYDQLPLRLAHESPYALLKKDIETLRTYIEFN